MRKALLIGNNIYHTKPLTVCLNDVDLMQSHLEKNPDDSTNFEIKTLKDEPSSLVALGEITKLFQTSCDCALLYFSGHGGMVGDKYCIAFAGDKDGANQTIDLSVILNLIIKSPAKQKVVILDSCRSGGMGQIDKTKSFSILGEGVSIIAACRENGSSLPGKNYSIFTEILCVALEGAAAAYDGSISLNSVYSYVEKFFSPLEQRPVFKTNTSEAVILKYVTPVVPKDTILRTLQLFSKEDAEYCLDPSYEFSNCDGSVDRQEKPYATPEHVAIFKDLQALERIGLVSPTGEEHMYWAAMRSKTCHLTKDGQFAWLLMNKKLL